MVFFSYLILIHILVMTWALYFLATHEDMQDKLYAEVTKYYKGGPITWDMIKNMRYVASFSLSVFDIVNRY